MRRVQRTELQRAALEQVHAEQHVAFVVYSSPLGRAPRCGLLRVAEADPGVRRRSGKAGVDLRHDPLHDIEHDDRGVFPPLAHRRRGGVPAQDPEVAEFPLQRLAGHGQVRDRGHEVAHRGGHRGQILVDAAAGDGVVQRYRTVEVVIARRGGI